MAKKNEKSEIPAEAAPNYGAYVPVAVGWFVPGGGHLWQRKWGRGLLLMVSVTAMFVLGLLMRGKIYHFNTADIVDMLACLADLGAGGLYLGARFLGYDVPEPPTAVADYGTKFLLVAGLLNSLVMLDAYDIAVGKKQ